jgi:large subunit ribosomal protein L9
MKVILLERVAKLGHFGQEVNVKDGYARNFLLPKGKALRSTAANLARFEKEREIIAKRNAEQKAVAEGIAAQLNGKTFPVVRQAGETGQLYGSVSTRDISEVLAEAGFEVSRSQVALNEPIKKLGLHVVPVHLHGDVELTININIARSLEEATRQERGENLSVKEDVQPEYELGGFEEEMDAAAVR